MSFCTVDAVGLSEIAFRKQKLGCDLNFDRHDVIDFSKKGKRHGVQPQNGIPGFLCIFQKKSAMATLGLKEMGKFL